MTFKFFSFYIIVTIVVVTAAPKRDIEYRTAEANQYDETKDKRKLAALLVKDENDGEFRFLTGTGSNSALNQYITQKQEMLEQLRPSSTGTGSGVFLTGTGSATGTFGSSTGAVTPIIVNLASGTSTTTGSNAGLAAIATNVSPIGDILPQVIGQAVLGSTRRRRRPANRRVVNRRVAMANNRRRRRPNRNQPKVVVLRP